MNGRRVTLADLRHAVADSRSAMAAHELGHALVRRREYAESLEWLMLATDLDPFNPEWHFDVAKVLSWQERGEAARDAAQRGVTLAPHQAQGWLWLGNRLRTLTDMARALDAYVRAVECDPGDPEACVAVCGLVLDGASAEEAEFRAYERVRHVMERLPFKIGLATALARNGRDHDALVCWTSLLNRWPEHPVVLQGTARAEMVLGNLDAAERLYARGLELYPDNLPLTVGALQLFLRTGRVDEIRTRARVAGGGRRLASVELHPDDGSAPVWDGTQELSGKTILVDCTDGYGDTLQYCRFVPLLKQRAARVFVQALPQLQHLLRTLPGADDVVAPYDECDPFDYRCRGDHAAFLVDWTRDWIAATTPYLSVEVARQEHWRGRLDPAVLNVGILWRSQARDRSNPSTHRSMPLDALRPLTRLPGVKIYSLQVGSTKELTTGTDHGIAANLGAEFATFTDTAGAMLALDVIVGVDTAGVHLAGALRKPCCIALPYFPDERWMTDADVVMPHECYWYPSARLYPQEQPGDWMSVTRRIADWLAERVRDRAESDATSLRTSAAGSLSISRV